MLRRRERGLGGGARGEKGKKFGGGGPFGLFLGTREGKGGRGKRGGFWGGGEPAFERGGGGGFAIFFSGGAGLFFRGGCAARAFLGDWSRAGGAGNDGAADL